MKLHVVFDKHGEILGVARADTASPVRVRPKADEQAGHRAADVDVPAEYHDHDLATICQKLKVDVKGNVPQLKPKR
jgi:hypothetical protein